MSQENSASKPKYVVTRENNRGFENYVIYREFPDGERVFAASSPITSPGEKPAREAAAESLSNLARMMLYLMNRDEKGEVVLDPTSGIVREFWLNIFNSMAV